LFFFLFSSTLAHKTKAKTFGARLSRFLLTKLLIRFPASAAAAGEQESTPLNNSQIARGPMIISGDNEIESEHGKKWRFSSPFSRRKKLLRRLNPQEKETRVCDRALVFFFSYSTECN
jgi:hypothetical protein